MAGSLESPRGQRQEKAMSQRLLTMKFMQRAAASADPSANHSNFTSSIANNPPAPSASNGFSYPSTKSAPVSPHYESMQSSETKRRKLSPATPRTIGHVDSMISVPTDQLSFSSTPLQHVEVEASKGDVNNNSMSESPWHLYFPEDQESSSTPLQTTDVDSSQGAKAGSSLGRRTFGDFKKNHARIHSGGNPRDKQRPNSGETSLDSAPDSDKSHDFQSMRQTRGLGLLSPKQQGKNGKSYNKEEQSRRRRNDTMDTLALRKFKNGGISTAASAGVRKSGTGLEGKFGAGRNKAAKHK